MDNIMISIKELINSKAWSLCYQRGTITHFAFRLLAFRKKKYKGDFNIGNSKTVFLKLEVINLRMIPINDVDIVNNIFIKDQSNYKYMPCSYDFNTYKLNPKIIYTGTLLFPLPDNDHYEYYLADELKPFLCMINNDMDSRCGFDLFP